MSSKSWYYNLSHKAFLAYYASIMCIYEGTMIGYLIKEHNSVKESPDNADYTMALCLITHNRDVHDEFIDELVIRVMSDIPEFKYTNLADFYANIMNPYTPPEPYIIPSRPPTPPAPACNWYQDPTRNVLVIPPLNLDIDLVL